MLATAKLSREEPEAGNLHVRDCGGRGWQHPRLPGRSGATDGRTLDGVTWASVFAMKRRNARSLSSGPPKAGPGGLLRPTSSDNADRIRTPGATSRWSEPRALTLPPRPYLFFPRAPTIFHCSHPG